jgi:hypothetical protein
MHYVTEQAYRHNKVETRKQNRVWFDDIAVAAEYIGPVRDARK